MAATAKRIRISTSFGNVLLDSPIASVSIFISILKQYVFRFLRCLICRFV